MPKIKKKIVFHDFILIYSNYYNDGIILIRGKKTFISYMRGIDMSLTKGNNHC